ncbi:MAG: FAD:protein FMN transferase, partial [Thiobacillaceae bacterium]
AWHAARALCSALPGSIAVIRPGHAALAEVLRDAGCRVLESRDAEAGMGSALAHAVREQARTRYGETGGLTWLGLVGLADRLRPGLPQMMARLRAAGIRNALVNIGGNVMALGTRGSRPWRVGIQHPRRAGALATLDLHDGEAIGTSGDYQRYFEVAGRRYCHLIDPRSGRPVQGVQAVTVIARGPQAGVASDVASKPLFIAGPAGWRAMAERLGIREALLVDAAGRVDLTPAMARRINWEGEPPTPLRPTR